MLHEAVERAAELEPEVRAALAGHTERSLAKRSMSGAMVYFVVTVMLAFATSYRDDHPVVLGMVSALCLALGASRIVNGRRVIAQPAESLGRTRTLFLASLYGSLAVWGAFAAWTQVLYPGQWTSMYVLLATASLAAGGSSSLAPDLALAYRGLVLLIAPITIVEIAQGDRQSLAIAAGTVLFLAYLLAQTREQSVAFWNATIAAEREKLRGSEDRKRAEAERASLVAAIEQSAEQIVITDPKGIIQYCNPSFERATGYLGTEVKGRHLSMLKSGDQSDEFFDSLTKTIESGEVWSGHITKLRKDGTRFEAEGTVSPICDASGNISGFVSAMHDVTERVRMESELQQAQKMESVGRLAGGVAHDFNNLLTVIGGYTGLLENKLEEGDGRRVYVGEIKKAADRAAGLTRQLLTFSRRQLVRPKPIDLNALVGEMHRILQRLVGDDIEVRIAAAPSLGLVKADSDQMSQILLNLTANARDAMPDGGALTISTSNAGAHVLLAVSDTGVGIDEEAREHIFEPFYTTKEKGRGTGLGLATVYGIVQQSGGNIEVRSEPGAGSTFCIYLPRIDAAAAPDAAAPDATVTLRGSETVLVVEDHDDVRQLITLSLESCGFHVLQASNGRAALTLAAQYPGTIDLLVTDVIMPGMTGKEMADQLAPIRPELKVLYISGYSGEVIAHRGVLDAGVAYLGKPFTPASLAAKVREVLNEPRS
jgi:PAS domain S-box-containing protein